MMQVVPWIGRTVVQNAYVVEDLDAAMARWATVFGVGPFFANREIRIDDARYRGEPTELRFAGAIAQAGDVQIELIQQLDDSPSCYRDLYPAGREGFHHIAVFVDDLDADIARYEALGAPVAFSGVSRGMRFAYVDTSPMLGIMVELLEDVPSVRKAFALVAEAGRTWDGTDPVRGSASAAAAVT
jgi:hypothetical protein